MRSHAATSVGICAVRRIAFRTLASRELSAASGSNDERAETPVRSASIGVVFLGRSFRIATTFGEILRPAESALV
jgi:hypothetical protein